jgi:hypothetical protein
MTASVQTTEARRSVIEIRIREIAQLFNSLDPSPFHERDLDDDAEAYIVAWARELPADALLRLVVHLPASEAKNAEERGLAASLTNYFGERAEMLDRDLRELFRNGRIYLSIGVAVLGICLLTSNIVRASLGTGPVSRTLQEGLMILGWVANWKPLETFLYDWWPVKRRRDLYRRLRDATVEIKFRSDHASS